MYQLKRAGVAQRDLLKIYLSVIRPVLEYACPAWSTCLPKYLSDNLEMVQKRALMCIYPGQSYDNLIDNLKVPRLSDRREKLCRDYFEQVRKESHKLHALLPNVRQVPYEIRSCNTYARPTVRTSRYGNSFIPWCLKNCQ